MKRLYIDESGTHVVDNKSDPSTPVFFVAGVVLSNEELLLSLFSELKTEFFDDASIILHSTELTHPNKSKQKNIQRIKDKVFRNKFYFELNKIISNTDFDILGFLVRKKAYFAYLGEHYPNPYHLGFGVILDEYIKRLESNEPGEIILESRNTELDNQLLNFWNESKKVRLGLTTPEQLKEHSLDDLKIVGKSMDIPGLELADLVAYRMGRALSGKQLSPGDEIDLDLLNSKSMNFSSF